MLLYIRHSPSDTIITIAFGRSTSDELSITNSTTSDATEYSEGLGLGLSLLMPILHKAEIQLENRIFDKIHTVIVRF